MNKIAQLVIILIVSAFVTVMATGCQPLTDSGDDGTPVIINNGGNGGETPSTPSDPVHLNNDSLSSIIANVESNANIISLRQYFDGTGINMANWYDSLYVKNSSYSNSNCIEGKCAYAIVDDSTYNVNYNRDQRIIRVFGKDLWENYSSDATTVKHKMNLLILDAMAMCAFHSAEDVDIHISDEVYSYWHGQKWYNLYKPIVEKYCENNGLDKSVWLEDCLHESYYYKEYAYTIKEWRNTYVYCGDD